MVLTECKFQIPSRKASSSLNFDTLVLTVSIFVKHNQVPAQMLSGPRGIWHCPFISSLPVGKVLHSTFTPTLSCDGNYKTRLGNWESLFLPWTEHTTHFSPSISLCMHLRADTAPHLCICIVHLLIMCSWGYGGTYFRRVALTIAFKCELMVDAEAAKLGIWLRQSGWCSCSSD